MQRSIAVLLGVAIAVVAGTLLFARFMDERRREAEVNLPREPAAGESRPAAAESDLQQSIDELRTEIRRLREALAERPPAPAAISERASADLGPTLARLTHALEQLGAARPAFAAAPKADAPLVVPPPRDAQKLQPLLDLMGRDRDGAARAHRFWSYEDVRSRYGDPDAIFGMDGSPLIRWSYRTGKESPVRIEFHFFDGAVTNVQPF